MTVDTTLTPEERAVAPEGLVKALEQPDNPVGKAWLVAWRKRQSMSEEAIAQAEEIHQEISAAMQEPEQGNLAHWCGFPTDMTRCSPFFPMNQNQLGDRRYLEDFIITSANWGEIKYTGPQLSTYDEDVLLSILYALENQSIFRKVSFVTESEFHTKIFKDGVLQDETMKYLEIHKNNIEGSRKTYTYEGPILPILKILGMKKVGRTNYIYLLKSLRRLIGATLELTISTGKTKSGKKRQSRRTHIVSILGGVYWDDNKKELSVTVNPFFYETYIAGRVTLMDVAKRMRLKGSISKALYRFVQSQRRNPVFEGHFLTLADALNMDREHPMWKNRQLLKTAINELVQNGVLVKKSGFVDQDIVRLHRTSEAFPTKSRNMLETH